MAVVLFSSMENSARRFIFGKRPNCYQLEQRTQWKKSNTSSTNGWHLNETTDDDDDKKEEEAAAEEENKQKYTWVSSIPGRCCPCV